MRTNLQRLFFVFDRWKWHYLLSGVLLVLAIFVRSLEPKILQIAADNVIAFFLSDGTQGKFSADFVSQLFYRVLPEISMSNLEWVLTCLGIIYMAISVLRGGLLLSSSALTAASTEKAINKLRDDLFGHIQKLPLSYFIRTSKGELLQRSTGDVDTVRRFILNQIVDIIRMAAIFIIAFIMMYVVHRRYAFITIACSPLLILSSYWFFKKERKVWEKHEEEADKLNALVQENLNGIRVVKAFANEKYEMAKFDRQNLRKRHIGIKHVLLHSFFWPLSDLLVHVQITISIVAGGYFAITNQITVGELLGFYTYIRMVAWPMRQMGRLLSKMGIAMVAIGRIYDILDEEEEKQQGAINTGSLSGEIEFRHVSFKYAADTKGSVLDNVSFKIQAGEKIAIIGPTGCGKSTIINLLIGLYEADAGDILLDGVPINKYAKKFLRQKIGVVLQTPFLFSTTVRKNIAYARPDAVESEIAKAAEVAQVHDIEEMLTQGYDTIIGEKGVTLSGGQKQRVALARAVLSTPDILVLDDITSAVDTETEHAIFEALAESMDQRTTIIISHRITSIQQADRILVVTNGRIVQEGTPVDLETEAGGYYQGIYSIQAALEEEIEHDISSA